MRPTRRFVLALALAAAALPAAAADRPTLNVGLTFLAGGLDPAQGSAGWALVSHGVAEQLFTVSREGTVVPRLAERAERLDERLWQVTLAPGRAFSDGAPVDAAAVAAALNRTGEKNPAARASAGRLTATVTDTLTLRIETERPTPVLPAVLAEWAFPIYRETAQGLLFTGPFAVKAFEPGARLSLVPNPHFPRAGERPDLTLIRVADGQALALALKAGELDLAFNLPVEALPMLRADPALTVKTFPVEYQYMM